MGLFEKVFGRRPDAKRGAGRFETFTAYAPALTPWGGDLYKSELVRSAIDARARHISKLQITVRGSAQPKLQTRLRQAPNSFQTWGQFLYRLSTILDMQNNAFIVPVLGEYGEKVGMFPVLPSRCELVQAEGEPWLRYTFSSGKRAAMPLCECGVMTKYQYRDDFFGENNDALGGTMNLMNIHARGIEEAVKNSNTFRFTARLTNFSSPEDLAKERKRFSENNLRGDGGGILLFPNTYSDVRQVDSKPFVADAQQLSLIRENVYGYFGVNEKILKNIATGDEWASFYEGAVEPFAIQFSDVATRMLFSEAERARGAMLFATANRLQYMSNQDKLSVSSQMADRGIMNRDEIREIWNLPQLPDEQGQAYTIRGEYYLLGTDGSVTKHGDDLTGGKGNAAKERARVPRHAHGRAQRAGRRRRRDDRRGLRDDV